MSDLVLLCGPPPLASEGSPVRLEPNFGRRITDERTVSAYFEVGHLGLDARGESRLTYRYTLRAADPGRPTAALLEASREVENVGSFRRQYVSAPLPELAPGLYDFAVEVHDLLSGSSATRSMRFAKG